MSSRCTLKEKCRSDFDNCQFVPNFDGMNRKLVQTPKLGQPVLDSFGQAENSGRLSTRMSYGIPFGPARAPLSGYVIGRQLWPASVTININLHNILPFPNTLSPNARHRPAVFLCTEIPLHDRIELIRSRVVQALRGLALQIFGCNQCYYFPEPQKDKQARTRTEHMLLQMTGRAVRFVGATMGKNKE